MKRNLLIFLSIFMFISFININAYATIPDDKPKEITVKLNGKTLEFDTNPIIVNDRTMVPMRMIFEQLGAQVTWYDEKKIVTGYRRYKNFSDMFIKLKIGDNIAYRNGNEFNLDSPPIIRNSRTLVPVRFIAESFGIEVEWDNKTKTVLLSSDNNNSKEPKVIDNTSYVPKYFDSGINLMIPEYWDNSDAPNKFGYKDEEDNIQMTIDITELEESKTLDEFTEENRAIILDNYKDKVVFTGSDNLNINNININVVYLKNTSISPEINQVIYYFTTEKYGYNITFSYYSQSNDSQLLNIISNILNTIEITGVISTEYEHYIEYDAFFNYDINLNSKISSSMEVENEFNFNGTISEESNLEYFIVEVSKDDEKCKFKIPISDYKFDSKIYTPFKLGKHNVTILAPQGQDNYKVMQFNVLNYSTQDIRYIIPSMFVEKDDNEILALANEITKDINKYLPEYDESKAIFKWIYENIEYDSEGLNLDSRSAKKVLTDKKGTNEEISYLYAALLRALDIPCKIVKGKIDDNYHVWNEIKINGKWIIADVTWGSGYIDNESMSKNLNMDYFDIDREEYENKFTEITTLEY